MRVTKLSSAFAGGSANVALQKNAIFYPIIRSFSSVRKCPGVRAAQRGCRFKILQATFKRRFLKVAPEAETVR